MRNQKLQILGVFFFCLTGSLFSQHSVKVKIGKQVYTVSGDTTKYNFKATIAKLESRFVDAANFKEKAIEHGELSDVKLAYYDMACYYSKGNAIKASSTYLLKSIDAGWSDLAHLEYDADLTHLRNSKYWKTIIPRIEEYYKGNNKELAKMYAEDQLPRLTGKMNDEVVKEDEQRRERVLTFLKKKKIRSADDYYKAAMIMHHGNRVKDYKLAHRLAKKAFKKKNPHIMAPWLVAATKDRYLLKKGKKQWYATQGLTFKNGKMALDPQKIDTTAVKNKKRIALNAPSIEKIRSYIKAFNTKK